jgi:DNA-binding NarL/FixJ family response regulator
MVVAQHLHNGTPPGVVLFDSHPAAREGLAFRLIEIGYRICGETGTAVEALQLLSSTSPSVVVMDVSLKIGSGMELLKRIAGSYPATRVLVWSRYRESIFAERVIRAGAAGYIEKDRPTVDVVTAVRHVVSGKVYLSPEMTEVLLRQAGGKNGGLANDPIAELSDRELEVFRMIGLSRDTEQIARELHLSQKTVETYRSRIKTKFGADSSAELLRLAVHWELENG